MSYSLDKLGTDAVNALVRPISDKLNDQIDKIAIQGRKALAKQRGVPENQITDLEVAELIANLPTSKLTGEISDKMEYIGDSTRNGLIIGFGLIAIAILVTAIAKKNKA